jgi:hypothetical protein
MESESPVSTAANHYVPTARLRWLIRPGSPSVLQQWYAPEVPAYMLDPKQGEWRDVEIHCE